MQKYQYQHGDRPLDGYTIQRAAGRGGFGEVYYAVSDSGREVAIKAVQNYEQIELRGISQCMNLKSPHLVTIFDVKYNDRNEPFVIMEYVSGPSLRDLLTESPNGIGVQKAAFFLREIAKGLSFLHECGIVHRDLKPSNIFYENGYVKVGDYGLTKAISASRHSGHTITVGTVHYMAPEIGAGSYNCSIDIYALGVLLYEMLTGEVPFDGSSPAEILMKHMTVTPKFDNIEETFARVIRKALAKDPADRYQTVQEIVENLFGSENIRNSVSHFSPDELSVIAQRVASKANIGGQPGVKKPKADVAVAPTKSIGKQITETAQRIAQQADALGQKVADKVDAKTGGLLGAKKMHIPGVTDPIHPGQRRTLALVTMIIVAIGAGLLHGQDDGGIIPTALSVFVMTGVCAKIILISQRHWFVNLEPQSQWIGKLATCCLASLLATIIGVMLLQFFGLPSPGSGFNPFGFAIRFPFRFFGLGKGIFNNFNSTWLSMMVPMFLVDWQRISSPERSKRLSLGSALWIGLLSVIASKIFGSSPIVIAAVLAGTSLVVQTASPFGQTIQRGAGAQPQPKKKDTKFHKSLATGVVPASMRIGWFIGALIALSLGLSFIIWGGMQSSNDDYAIGVAAGVDGLILSIFFFIGFCRSMFTGWYRYLVKPAILLVCVLSIVASSICMGNMNLYNDEFAVSLFLIIFPAIAFCVIAFLPASMIVGKAPKTAAFPAPPPPPPQPIPGVSSFKRLWALLLAVPGLTGFPLAGLHRFYVGKIGTGILWFLTGGMFLIGQIIDMIMILTGHFKDRYGLPLVIWQDKAELSTKTPDAKPVGQPLAPEREAAVAKDQPAEAVQSPSAKDSPARAAPIAPTTTVIYEPFHPFAFLFSGIGFILTFAAIITGLAVGLHIPYFAAAGWPDPEIASELEQFFGYPGWPDLVMRLGTAVVTILLLFAAVFMIIGRRHLGARHLLRAVLGLAGFLGAVMMFIDQVSGYRFNEVVDMLNSQQIGSAVERLLEICSGEGVIFAGIIFLVSVVVLAWPASHKQTILTQTANQGVS